MSGLCKSARHADVVGNRRVPDGLFHVADDLLHFRRRRKLQERARVRVGVGAVLFQEKEEIALGPAAAFPVHGGEGRVQIRRDVVMLGRDEALRLAFRVGERARAGAFRDDLVEE